AERPPGHHALGVPGRARLDGSRGLGWARGRRRALHQRRGGIGGHRYGADAHGARPRRGSGPAHPADDRVRSAAALRRRLAREGRPRPRGLPARSVRSRSRGRRRRDLPGTARTRRLTLSAPAPYIPPRPRGKPRRPMSRRPRTMPWKMPFRLLAVLCLGIVVPQVSRADGGAGASDPAKVQRMLKLLSGIAGEYREAFDDQGAIVRPIDIDETRLLLGEVNDLTAPLRASDPGLRELIGNIGTLVDMHVPPDIIGAYTEVARRYLMNATGVREDILPTERPSLARGQELYRENCAGCHGANGAGDGPDAAHLAIPPASFSDRAFMRAETPRDAFNVIMLGRQKSGMPAWGDALSPQQAWDLVSYLWSFGRTPAEVDAGRQVYAARCAGCHGANGDPVTSQAPLLDRPGHSLAALVDGAGRSDAD